MDMLRWKVNSQINVLPKGEQKLFSSQERFEYLSCMIVMWVLRQSFEVSLLTLVSSTGGPEGV